METPSPWRRLRIDYGPDCRIYFARKGMAFDREGVAMPYPHAVEMSKGEVARRDAPIKAAPGAGRTHVSLSGHCKAVTP